MSRRCVHGPLCPDICGGTNCQFIPHHTDDSTISVEKLLIAKKEFDAMFPPRDDVADYSAFAQALGQVFGFRVVPQQGMPDNCIAVSPKVYQVLRGK